MMPPPVTEATAERNEATAIASSPPLKGLIALDVEPFFADVRVKKILADKRLSVAVTRVGSREMAAMVQPGATADFLFPSGLVAANQIAEAARKAKIAVAQSSPFYTPMVIASWQPIAKILVAKGMAKPLGDRTFGVDIAKLTDAMLAKKRWKDLKGAEGYDVSRGVLVSTTDVRRSNLAAMYLALTSYAKNGDVLTDRATAEPLTRRRRRRAPRPARERLRARGRAPAGSCRAVRVATGRGGSGRRLPSRRPRDPAASPRGAPRPQALPLPRAQPASAIATARRRRPGHARLPTGTPWPRHRAIARALRWRRRCGWSSRVGGRGRSLGSAWGVGQWLADTLSRRCRERRMIPCRRHGRRKNR